MIKFTCQPPHIRSAKIAQGIQLLQHEENEYLKEFNIQIDPEMITLDAKILDTPTISYHPASKEPTIVPRDGSWNLRDKMVAQGIVLSSWGVVVFAPENDYPVNLIQEFITSLVSVSEECGLVVQSKKPSISYGNPNGNIEKILIDTYVLTGNNYQSRPQLILCILPNSNIHLYSEIKRVSDTVIGIPTQCIQGKNMHNTKRQYFVNVCLKINVKMGGMNSYLAGKQLVWVCDRPTIVFGAALTVHSLIIHVLTTRSILVQVQTRHNLSHL
jgi:eukaryotic translation initiation factor 2C